MKQTTIMATRPEGLVPRPLGRQVQRLRRSELLPPLAPVEATPETRADAAAASRPTLEQALRLSQHSAREESTDFRRRSEPRDPTAIMTVYAINLCVMVFAFPLGLALLVFNILGGENLRTTAHVMALTGLASSLSLMGLSVPFLS